MEKYILIGSGKNGKNALKFLGEDKVFCFCDNNEKIIGQCVDGKIVRAVAELPELLQENRNAKAVITITKAQFLKEIVQQLTNLKVECSLFEEVVKEIIIKESEEYEKKNTRATLAYDGAKSYPIWMDRYSDAGSIHSYFWQDLWAARKIFQNKPTVHYDIGSRIDGFVAHLSSFHQQVNLIDIRPFEHSIPNVSFTQADATNLDGIEDNSIESLSALCSLEHFGLGRYGDEMDPEACFKCFAAIQKKLAYGGKVYISVPIGKEHLEFNAHRVFLPQTIVDSFSKLTLLEFSSCYVEQMEENVDIHKYDEWYVHGGERFGLFEFQKDFY